MTSAKSLLASGRIEKIEEDVDAGLLKLEDAQRHLASAELIRQTDPDGAYALLYDAARKRSMR